MSDAEENYQEAHETFVEDDDVKLLEVRSWRRARGDARRGADDAQYQLLEQNMRFVRV